MEAAELSTLESLDDELLYIFVAGTGAGEAISVALPRKTGWLIVDGASVGAESIPAHLVARFAKRGYPAHVAAFVLTHPHDDHAKGVPQLLEQYPPAQAWVTAERPEGPHLVQVCESMVAELRAKPRSVQDKLRGTRAAFIALSRWLDEPGRELGCAVDGQVIDVSKSPVTIHVRAPVLGEGLSTILAELAGGIRKRANEASVVLELSFGATRLVLGGDLPRVHTKKTLKEIATATPLATGWQRVMRDHAHLAEHSLLKLAHHGSAAAWDPTLMAPPPRSSREWVVTPFASQGLPRAELMPELVKREHPIRVSHRPPSWSTPSAWSFSSTQIQRMSEASPTGDAFADAAEDVRPRPPADPLEPIWGFAYDDAGVLRGSWRGSSAVEVRLG